MKTWRLVIPKRLFRQIRWQALNIVYKVTKYFTNTAARIVAIKVAPYVFPRSSCGIEEDIVDRTNSARNLTALYILHLLRTMAVTHCHRLPIALWWMMVRWGTYFYHEIQQWKDERCLSQECTITICCRLTASWWSLKLKVGHCFFSLASNIVRLRNVQEKLLADEGNWALSAEPGYQIPSVALFTLWLV